MKQIIFILFIALTLFSCNTSKQKRSKKYHILKINNIDIKVETAISMGEQSKGLMHRHKLENNSGMLFIYKQSRELSFWMKNTHIPLSIAFIDKNGIIKNIVKMDPYDGRPDYMLPNYKSKGAAKYALEMNQDWFYKMNIKAGNKVIIPNSVKELTK